MCSSARTVVNHEPSRTLLRRSNGWDRWELIPLPGRPQSETQCKFQALFDENGRNDQTHNRHTSESCRAFQSGTTCNPPRTLPTDPLTEPSRVSARVQEEHPAVVSDIFALPWHRPTFRGRGVPSTVGRMTAVSLNSSPGRRGRNLRAAGTRLRTTWSPALPVAGGSVDLKYPRPDGRHSSREP